MVVGFLSAFSAAARSGHTLSLQTTVLRPRRTFGLATKLIVDYIVSSIYARALRVLEAELRAGRCPKTELSLLADSYCESGGTPCPFIRGEMDVDTKIEELQAVVKPTFIVYSIL